MSRDRDDRTIIRGGAVGRPEPSGSSGRDDKTRMRVPAVSPSGDRGYAAPGARPGKERRTLHMQAVPARFGWLIVKEGERVGQVYRLGVDVTDIGRGLDNDIVVDDDRASEEHARIRVDEEGRFVVWDLASTNGTFINGERIMAATPIVENDEVKVGRTLLVLKTLDVSPAG